MADPQSFDIVILGGGAGLTAAYYAQKDGKSIALIDQQPNALGGTCVNRGCIPTKGLVQAAETLETVRDAGRFGIHLDQESVKVDFKQILDTVRLRREKGAGNTKGWVDDAFTPFYGPAKFVGDKIIEVETEDGTVQVTGDKLFVVPGASPAVPPIPGLKDVPFWTNEHVLELTEHPESLLIMGGGYIGVELAHFFATIGTKVTIVEMFDVVPAEDEDLKQIFRDEFSKKATILEGHKAVEAFQAGEGGPLGLVVEGPDGDTQRLTADALLVAVGRVPNTRGLGLEATGVELNERGWVQVDDHLRTAHPDIYAYGDVIGQGMFKHTSSHEGEAAYRNSQGADIIFDYSTNPHAIFTDPQMAGVGITEKQAAAQGLSYSVHKAPYKSIAKANILGSPPGLAKLIVENDTDRILGFHMAGPHSADLVHEVVVAMNAPGAKASLIRDTIHIHPTMPELVKSVFDAAGGK